MKQNSSILLMALFFVMTIWSCGNGADQAANKDKPTQQKKEQVAGKKSSKNDGKNSYGGRILSKRSAKGRLLRVQGTPTSGESNFNVAVKDGKVKFLGWAYDDITQEPAQKVFLEINGSRFGTSYGHDNPALAKRLNNPKLNKTAFRCSVSAKDVKGKLWNVKLITYSSNGKAVSVSKEPIAQIRIK